MRKVYFSRAFESNRRVQVCNSCSLKKLCFFKVWCLAELVKIVECMTKTGLTILLVFYHVDPSDVRNQMEILAEAFPKHEKDPKINIEDVQAWKAALKEVGNISGWHVNDRYYLFLQSIFVQIISINFEILYSLKLFTSPRLTFNMKNFSFFFLSNRIKETFSFSSKNLVHSLRHSSLLLNYSMWINKGTDLVINPHSISDSSQRSFPSCS